MCKLIWLIPVLFFISTSTVQAQYNVNNCGILTQGFEGGCIMFLSEMGVKYEVNDPSSFGPGDTVHIRGFSVPCYTFCFPEYCLYVQSISYCYGADCCGFFTAGATGNVDCDSRGQRNLADITRLIDAVYISTEPLCCEGNGNTDGDNEGKVNLADITRLIDHIYITKQETATCPSG